MSNLLTPKGYTPPSSNAAAPATTTASEAPTFAAPAAALPNADPNNYVDLTAQEDLEVQAVSSTSSEPIITQVSHPRPHTPRTDLLVRVPKSASRPSTGTLSRMEGGSPPSPGAYVVGPIATTPP